jgi:hypothetical protein
MTNPKFPQEARMIFGMAPFVVVHVLIRLIGIASGFVVLFGLLEGKRMDGLTVVFLLFTALASVIGFMLSAPKLMPSHTVGTISLVFLAAAILARYKYPMAGSWRRRYVITAAVSRYLAVFVLTAQRFPKVPALKAMAPTGPEPPFLIAQTVCVLFFVLLGVFATIQFRPMAAAATV